MQENIKMILQEDEHFANKEQQYSDSFCERIDSKSAFYQQIWYMLCLIFMIHILNICTEMVLIFHRNFFTSGNLDDSEMPFEHLFQYDPLFRFIVLEINKFCSSDCFLTETFFFKNSSHFHYFGNKAGRPLICFLKHQVSLWIRSRSDQWQFCITRSSKVAPMCILSCFRSTSILTLVNNGTFA